MIFGANTYKQVLGFEEWPYRDTPAIVTTRREMPRVTDHVEFYDGSLEGLVHDVTGTHGLIWLVGGAALARSFLAKNLIDKIQLSIIPILLGRGIALFSESGIKQELHLTDEIAYENGIVELHYDIRDQ